MTMTRADEELLEALDADDVETLAEWHARQPPDNPVSDELLADYAVAVPAPKSLEWLYAKGLATPRSLLPPAIGNPTTPAGLAVLDVALRYGFDPNQRDGVMLARYALRNNRAAAERLFAAGADPHRVRFDRTDNVPPGAAQFAPRLHQWHQHWLGQQAAAAAGEAQLPDDPVPRPPSGDLGL